MMTMPSTHTLTPVHTTLQTDTTGTTTPQRLPRLVGLQKAIEMMLTSAPIRAEQGLKLGLVDAVVPREQLLAVRAPLALAVEKGWRQGRGGGGANSSCCSEKKGTRRLADRDALTKRLSSPHPN